MTANGGAAGAGGTAGTGDRPDPAMLAKAETLT